MSFVSREPFLLRRLSTIADLTDSERKVLRQIPMTIRDIPPRTDLVHEGDRPEECFVVLEGLVIRYKLALTGDRRIIAFHVPGDVPDLQSLHLARMDHNVASLTSLRAGFIPHRVLHELNVAHPRIAGALWRATLVDASMFREWIVNLGHRDALSRTAHFLCEMHFRLEAVGLADVGGIELPITQGDLADTLGVSAVHMNRTIQELRARQLIEDQGRAIVCRDWRGLRQLGEFDPGYLHITPSERPDPA